MDHNRAYKLGRAFRLGLAFSLGKQHQQGMAMDRWITIHPYGKGKNADYRRIFINDDTGVIESGAGGKWNGKTLKEAFSKPKTEPWTGTVGEMKYQDMEQKASVFIRVAGKQVRPETKRKYADEFMFYVKDYASGINDSPENKASSELLGQAISYWDRRKKEDLEGALISVKTLAEQVRDGKFKPESLQTKQNKSATFGEGGNDLRKQFEDKVNEVVNADYSGRTAQKLARTTALRKAYKEYMNSLPSGTYVHDGSSDYYWKKDGDKWNKYSFDDDSIWETTQKEDIPDASVIDRNPDGTSELGYFFGVGKTFKEANNDLKKVVPFKGLSVAKKPEEKRDTWAEEYAEAKKREDGHTSAGINDIDKDTARRAFYATSFDPEGRGERFRQDYAKAVNAIYDTAKQYVKTPEQQEWLNAEFDKSRARILDAARSLLAAEGRTMSAAVVGPAKFPYRQQEKRQNTAMNRASEYSDAIEKAEKHLVNGLKNLELNRQATSAGMNPEEYEVFNSINKQLNYITATKRAKKENPNELYVSPTHYKNNIYNRLETQAANGNVEFVNKALETLRESGHYKPTEKVFRLSELAERKRKERQAASQNTNSTRSGKTYEGVEIVRNTDENRLQLMFDEMPSYELRQSLKQSGWRWSPRNQAWQRQLTSNAEYSADRILSQHFGKSEDE